jgi:RyR domain
VSYYFKWVEATAAVCHGVNRAYCASQGDQSQPTWDEAPEWQRQSAITGVRFALEHPDAGPAASHESWLAEKRRDGWVYGPEKDPVLKTHPCFVPYDELPPSQKAKDYIFLAVVRELMAGMTERSDGKSQG